MATQIRFTVPGIPVAQPRQRHRVIQSGGRAFAANYTPRNDPVNLFKASVQQAAQAVYDGPPIDGPVLLSVIFVLPRPKGMVWKTRPMPRERHTKKPDAENILKALQDALVGLAFRDDSQVCDVHVEKWIASGHEQPHTGVLIEQIEAVKPEKSVPALQGVAA